MEGEKVEEYKKPYWILFRACEDALKALEAQNYGQARELLIRGEQDAEESFLSFADEE